jgi:digalactosyldiacylglycerol synthase
VFPNSVTFDSPADQEAFVREWAQKRTGLACSFKVRFYPGRYAPEKGGWQELNSMLHVVGAHV